MNSSPRLTWSTRLVLWRGVSFVAAAAWASGGVACAVDDGHAPAFGLDAGTSSDALRPDRILQLQYTPMYSAFVEGHAAELPVIVKNLPVGVERAKFTSSDPTIASVADTPLGATITVHKDGRVEIAATLGASIGKAALTISKFSAAQWTAGQARYAKSELAFTPVVSHGAIAFDPSTRNPDGACNSCHGAQAKVFRTEVTPTQTAGYSDQDLITLITRGQRPEGWPSWGKAPADALASFHLWTVSEEEQLGLVAFLRTQAPASQIEIEVTPVAPARAHHSSVPPL